MLDTLVYTICLDLRGRRALVVGSGPLVREKVEGLRASEAEVVVVTRDPDVWLEEAAVAGDVELRRKVYDGGDLEDFLLVIAATTDRELGAKVFADAEARNMLVNVTDMPELCNFILPAIARRGPLTIAVSTSGASPALAKRIRDEVDTTYDDAFSRLAQILDELRPWARSELRDYAARRDFFDALVNGDPDPIDLLRAGAEDELRELIGEAQRRAESQR